MFDLLIKIISARPLNQLPICTQSRLSEYKGHPSHYIFISLKVLEIPGGSRNSQSSDSDFAIMDSQICFTRFYIYNENIRALVITSKKSGLNRGWTFIHFSFSSWNENYQGTYLDNFLVEHKTTDWTRRWPSVSLWSDPTDLYKLPSQPHAPLPSWWLNPCKNYPRPTKRWTRFITNWYIKFYFNIRK